MLLEAVVLAVVKERFVFTNVLAVRCLLISGEESPARVEVDGSVELLLSVVESQDGAVYSDDISDSLHDGQVFEPSGVQDQLSPRVLLSRRDGRVSDLQGADVLVVIGLVGESGVKKNCIKTDRRSVNV